MRWSNGMLLAGLFFATCAMAGSIEDTLSKSSELLKSGQPEKALQLCQEIRVEFPESETLLFAIGAAQAALGEALLARNDHRQAGESFRRACETFARSAPDASGRLGAASRYNAATCLLRLDATFDPIEAYEARIENLRAAVAAFEACVALHPDEARARKNLDFARYTLNLLLQHPPKENEENEETPEAENPEGQSGVNSATTQIPGATATVVDGSTVVLQRPGAGEPSP